jgi:Mlc titration factor MtfA (ptsG expression regulator)
MLGFKRRRRQRIRSRPFPPAWLAIVERNVAYYRRLTPAEQAELRDHIQVFIDEKRFEGCGGLEITDEIRVTIAAQACILLLHRQTDYYPRMETILVYPHRYLAEATVRLPGGAVLEGTYARLGESWYRGPVVLSWDDVRRASASSLINWTASPGPTRAYRCCRAARCTSPGRACSARSTRSSSKT